MVRKLMLLIICLLLCSPSSAAYAEVVEEPVLQQPSVIVSEIYPNAPGPSEKGAEFVRLTNVSTTHVSLTGYALYIGNSEPVLLPEDIGLQPDSSLVVFPLFATLTNVGSTVKLQAPDETVATQSVTYPSGITDDKSWQLIDDTWAKADVIQDGSATIELELKTDDPEDPPVESPPSTTVPDVPVCQIENILINEILANPAGADTAGGEFIELYNAGDEQVSLTGCMFTTNKMTNYEIGDVAVQPGGYYIVQLADKLLNGGGQVTFITHSTEEVIEYLALGDDEAWALIDDSWQITELATPGAFNQPTPPEPPAIQEEVLEPCPAGKFRNPETNRCKNIVETAGSLLPCATGETRNPETNRCRKVASATTTLTPCKPGQERNPETNRCRQVASASTSLVPCQEGYERNPDTNRCRKVTTGNVAGAATFPVSSQTPLHPGILLSLTFLTIAYGIYEYRYDLGNLAHKLRLKQTKNK